MRIERVERTSHGEDHEDDARDRLDDNQHYASLASAAEMMLITTNEHDETACDRLGVNHHYASATSQADHNHHYAPPACPASNYG